VDPYCRPTGELHQLLSLVTDHDAEEAHVGDGDLLGSLGPFFDSNLLISPQIDLIGWRLLREDDWSKGYRSAVSTSLVCHTRCHNSATTARPGSPSSIAIHPTASSSRSCSCTGGRCG